jgi:integrase
MSIERARRGNGWVLRWREGDKQRSRLFDRKGDAEDFDADRRRRRQLGPLAVHLLTARDGATLDQWVEQRWAPEHAENLEASTRERYANVYACHVVRPLGDTPLNELGVARLREWQAAMVKGGAGAGTIDKARTMLSSVLTHAAESGAIMGNPLSLVRAPRSSHTDAVLPLSPAQVEAIRQQLLQPPAREVGASRAGQRRRRRYDLPPRGTPQSRSRDALIISLLAYAGLRPGELRALRWEDVGENGIHVQRATTPDGAIKATKTGHRRTVQLFSPLARDLREHRMAAGRPPAGTLLLADGEGQPWDKTAWQNWRSRRWTPACRAAGIDPVPRPYDLRHSFVSLLLATGAPSMWVAQQAGHPPRVLVDVYAHLIAELGERRVDATAEIELARGISRASDVRQAEGLVS